MKRNVQFVFESKVDLPKELLEQGLKEMIENNQLPEDGESFDVYVTDMKTSEFDECDFDMQGLGTFADTHMGMVELLKVCIARLDDKLNGVDDQGLGWTRGHLNAIAKDINLLQSRVDYLRNCVDGEGDDEAA